MKSWVVAVLLLVSCVQYVEPEVNETVYSPEVVQAATPMPQNMTQEPEINATVLNETIQNVTENTSNAITGSVVEEFEDLSIGAAHKLTPELEAAVRNASCYNLTWIGLAEQQQKRPIEVRKIIRFNYMGGRLFKGWIASTISINNEMIDSQTVEVLVEFMQVTCIDNENFTIDWDEKLKRSEEHT